MLVRRRLRELRWPLAGRATLCRVDVPSGVRVDSDRGVDEEPVVEIGEKKSYSDDCCDDGIAGDEDGVGIAAGIKPRPLWPLDASPRGLVAQSFPKLLALFEKSSTRKIHFQCFDIFQNQRFQKYNQAAYSPHSIIHIW